MKRAILLSLSLIALAIAIILIYSLLIIKPIQRQSIISMPQALLTPAPTQAMPANLLSNPGFEGGYIEHATGINVAPGWLPSPLPIKTLAPTPTGTSVPQLQNVVNVPLVLRNNWSFPSATPVYTGIFAASIWFQPASITALSNSDFVTTALSLNTSARMGGIDTFEAYYSIEGLEIIRIVPGTFFTLLTNDEIAWNDHEIKLLLEGKTIKRSGIIAWIVVRGQGTIRPLTNYSTFIGTDTGGGITPESGIFIVE